MNFGALFDWDGVVIDSSDQHERAWEMLAEEFGRTLPPDHFARSFGMKNRLIIPDILRWSDDLAEIEHYSQRKEAIYREIIAAEGIAPLPGVAELLHMLNERGIPCAVGSSTDRLNIEVIFDAIGLRNSFQAVVAAEDVDRGKPHPEVFLQGASAICRDPGRCVVFEDAHVGIEAGLAAGCKVIAVATTNEIEVLGAADLAVRSLADVSWDAFTGLFP